MTDSKVQEVGKGLMSIGCMLMITLIVAVLVA